MGDSITSAFGNPNILYKNLSGQTTQDYLSSQNQLLQQQQDIGGHEMEMASRLANTILDPTLYPTPEARAAAYPTLLANARAQAPGYFKNAPATYPGDDVAHGLARLGTPSQDLYKTQLGQQAAQGAITALSPPVAATAPAAGGGGTNAPPGTSTPAAPQNLADIHPDLTHILLPSGVGVTVAKSAAPQFQGLLSDLEAEGYTLDPKTTGGYNPRNIAGTNIPSQHAYGLAIDVNWQANPRGANTSATIPPDLARKLAAKWGLTWGGDWQGSTRDPMHFEVAQGGSSDHPAQAQAGGVATGWSANNPLNITTNTGGVVTPGGTRLATYGSMADGVAATAAKLQSYQTDRGLNTVRQMYTEWHKGSQVNDADMQRIAGAMGVGVDQPFQLDPTKTAAWISAAQPGETGTAGKRLSQADIAAGVRQASAAPPAAPGGVAARTGGTDVAGPGAGSGAATPAAPGQVAPTTAQGQAAPVTVAQVTPTAAPAAAPQMVTPGGQALPAPPQAPSLLSNGLTEQQWGLVQSQLKLAAPGGPAAIAKVLEQVPALANANRAALQQAWADAHPDLHFQETSSGAVAINPKDGHVVGTYSFAPNMQSRAVDGTGSWDGTKWVQGGPNDTPGKWVYAGSNPVQFLPAAGRGPQATFELQRDLHKQDTDRLPQYNEQNQQAAANQIRIQQMRELIDQVTTGAGGPERANWANIADTMGWHDLAKRLVGMGGAAAAQEFAKYGLATAGAQERGDLGARGSLGAITLYKSANPGLELQPDANKKMLTAQLVAAQANRDYTQGAMDYVNRNGDAFVRGGNYTPLSHFDAEWAASRNPQIYAAAMGAINGDPWQKWTKGLDMKSTADVQRVIDIVRHADPTSTVMWNNGEPHAVGTSQ